MFTEEGNKVPIDDNLGTNIMFTECVAFWTNFPKAWLEYKKKYRKDYNQKLHPVIEWLLKDQKGGTNLRKILSLEHTSKTSRKKVMSKSPHQQKKLDWSFYHKLPYSCKLNAR